MWVRKRIDIRWRDLAFGLVLCLWPARRQRVREQLETLWSSSGDAFVCLSVRSGFDLLLRCLNLPPGSEVLLSAVTIPDMSRIVKEHDLIPVPVDLDPRSMAPDLDVLRAAITPKTRAIVVAHLFGGRLDLGEISRVAREHDLLLVEDCAQAFVGLHETGDEQADVSMHSFGPIKTNTALGGALFRVRRPELLGELRRGHQEWPCQTRLAFFRRLWKYVFIRIVCWRPIASMIARLCRLLGRNHDVLATRLARGFAGANFFSRIRRQPSIPLMGLLSHRLRTFDERQITARIERGHRLQRALGSGIPKLGEAAIDPTFWVFPIICREPDRVVAAFWRKGFDATRKSSLMVVPSEPGSGNGVAADHAAGMLENTVFLPFSRRMPNTVLDSMARLVREIESPESENPSVPLDDPETAVRRETTEPSDDSGSQAASTQPASSAFAARSTAEQAVN